MKKAVLLAGGRGTRLAPLTDTIPKPLMPFLDKTVLEQALILLSEHGFRDVVITVMYRAEQIRAHIGDTYLGMHIRYFHEDTPMGTAGALPRIRELLAIEPNESFLVMSGDCVCDFDLTDAIESHKTDSADATILTTHSENPLEYGIVVSDKNRRIQAILEKPPWSQVVGNRINAGIYLLNESLIRYVTATPFDFSHDLFPALLADSRFLKEYRAEGYWCDIGSLDSYKSCCLDALSGKIRGISPESALRETALSANGVRCIPPIFVSDSARIEAGTTLGPNTIVSHGSRIGKNCRISNSILLPNCSIEDNCTLSSALLCNGTHVPKNSFIENQTLSSQSAPTSEQMRQSISPLKKIADGYFLSPLDKSDTERLENFSQALAYAIGANEQVAVLHDSRNTAYYARTLSKLLAQSGVSATYCGKGFERLARFLPARLRFDCMLHLCEHENTVCIKIFNRNSCPPSRSFERKLEHPACLENRTIKRSVVLQNAANLYYNALAASLHAFKNANLKSLSIVFRGKISDEIRLLQKAVRTSGGTFRCSAALSLPHCSPCDICLSVSSDGEYTISQSDTLFDRYHIQASLLQHMPSQQAIALPYLSPTVYRTLTNAATVTHYPYRTAKRLRFDENATIDRSPNTTFPNDSYALQDELLSLARLFSLLCTEDCTLSDLASHLPAFGYRSRDFSVPNTAEKLRVLSHFSQKADHTSPIDRFEGIVVNTVHGQTTLVPQDTLSFRIYAEALSTEAAEQLCDETVGELSSVISQPNRAE